LDHTSVNRAITSLDVSNNSFCAEGTKLLAEALTSNQIMTELNVSSNYMAGYPAYDDMTGATALADAIADMGAILSVNVLFNDISAEQAHALANVLKEHATLKSLCGNKGNETELDISGKDIGAGGAIMLAPEIADNGAMSVLNLAENMIGGGYENAPLYHDFTSTPEGMTSFNLLYATRRYSYPC
jgi:Ran GTPase-activating protein (RanGAP) involved in mRNA processing and transport